MTGGGTGIGRQTALLLSRCGADVMLASRSEERLASTAEMIAAETGRKAQYRVTDVRDPAQVQAVVAATVDSFGTLDIVVNNAGGTYLRPLEEVTIEEWDKGLALNLTSVFTMTQAAIPHLARSGSGAIVNISSSSASRGTIGGAGYSAAKSGVEMFTKVSAAELSPRGIRVNCVAPGLVRSEGAERSWNRGGLDIMKSESRMPLRRVGEPIDIANIIVFLVSDASAYLTGEVLHADGGPQMDGIDT